MNWFWKTQWCVGASQVALVVKNPPANAGDVRDAGLILGLGRSPGRRHGYPLQYSCLENPMERGAWKATFHKVTKSQTWLKRLTCSHVWMWELHHKEGWAPKTCFQIVVLEKTLESPLDCKEIQPVNPKGNQSWIFIGRTDAEAPVLWLPDAKSQLFGKDPDAGKNWRQKEKWAAENKMVG